MLECLVREMSLTSSLQKYLEMVLYQICSDLGSCVTPQSFSARESQVPVLKLWSVFVFIQKLNETLNYPFFPSVILVF